jgi:outer membrane protein OmpA-like peptidoglycan-associated protein
MRLSNWLLTGTSITLFALAPLTVARAQDTSNAALVAAYQAYTADQSDANKQALDAACKAAGFASLDDCVKALTAPAPAPSKEALPPAPSSEAAPPPSSEAPPPPPSSKEEPKPAPSTEVAAPPSSSSSELPAAPAASSQEVPPPAPVSSEAPKPQPKPKPKPKQVPASSEEPAPVSSAEPAAPVTPSSEAAPLASSSEAPPPASSKEAAPPAPPASSQEAAPSSAAPAPSSAQPAAPSSEQPKNKGLERLKRAVDEYNQGVTDLSAGDKAGQAKIDDAKTKIDALCTAAGIPDTTACLAQFGLALNPLPPQPGEPSSATPEVTAPTSSEAPPTPSVPPVSELPKASEAVTPSAVEVLPSTVQPSEAAPLLDSQKDQTKEQAAPSSQEQSSSQQPPPPATPPAPPPKSDQQAQQDIKAPPPDQSLLTDKGKKIDVQQIQVQPPTDAQQPIKVIQFPKGPNGGPNNGGPTSKPSQNGNGGPPPQQPQDNGIIFQIGVNIVINNPDQERDRFYDPRQDQIYYEDLGRGRTRETIQRKDGSKIITVRDRTGDILQRSKVLPNGREIILATYDPRDQDIATWRDPGQDLPPLKLNIPADQYIMDADTSDDQQVYNFLAQPPVEQVRRIYTIDEVKRSARLRDSVRRLEVGDLTFDTGKATISRNQVGALQDVADAMTKLLQRNPGEVFLIEGHTDAVGSDVANLVLSDQRAATVARILTDFYDIPPENLVTQGYGERYLKVQTDGPEPLNRRVTIKRITPLITYASNK